jgi:hypothetical protein
MRRAKRGEHAALTSKLGASSRGLAVRATSSATLERRVAILALRGKMSSTGSRRGRSGSPAQQKPPKQEPSVQSPLTMHRSPGLQRRQNGSAPPQSTPVSVPSVTLSPQEMQMPRKSQLLLMQSLGCWHGARSGQRPQLPPPQSTPVSAPF